MNSIYIGIAVLNADYSVYRINMSFTSIFGYKQDDLYNKSIDILFNNYDYNILKKYINNTEDPNNIFTEKEFELDALHKDRTVISLGITIYRSGNDNDQKYILIIRNISGNKKIVESLKYLAYYDQLTKLPNRTLFRDRAETAIRSSRRDNEKLAIAYIDIDGFKVINDTLGHEAGDILLKELAQRFQGCVRESDTVSRVGGDEFTILMLKLNSLEDVSMVAERILQSNLVPVKINDQDIIPKTSIGISLFPQDGDNIDILLNNADKAMYAAKQNGNNQFMLYKHNMKKEAN